MKYNQGILETVVRTVPVGDVVADTAYVIGAEILVAVEDGTAGAYGVFVKRGCCGLEFLSGDEPAAGEACYLNNTTHKIEATPSATNYLIGCRNSSLEAGLPATRIMVDLDGTAASVYGVPGDIQGVTAGTGLTGGGTSGTVTLAVDTTLHPTMPAVGGMGTLVQTADTDRVLSDSGIAVANVPTMAAVGVAGNLLQTAADDRAISDSGIAVANVPQMAAVGGVDELLYTAAADRAVAKSGLTKTNTPQMAAAANAPGNLIQSAGADKTISDSGVAVANVPTMAAVGGLGNLLQTAAADRAISDAGIAVANVPTMAAAADAADRLILSAGADKTLTDASFGVEDVMRKSKFHFVEVTIALGEASGSSAAEPAFEGGAIFSCFPKSGNDQPVASVVLNGDGSVTVTVSAVETAEAKFAVAVYV